MATKSEIQQLQSSDNTTNIYPATLERAVLDDEGSTLDGKLSAISSSILSISGRIDNTQSDIAPVENGATSANAYDTGDYIIRENIFYKVIEDIAVGDAFTVGTNIRATKVVDEMGSGSGGSGGHTILDPSGTALTQRASLQFKRSTLTDDPTNDRTIVSPDGVADFKELNLTQSDLSASTTYARYPYEYTVAWAGATAGSFVKAHITNQNGTEYALPYAAEPFTDYVKLYLANALTAQVHVELYLLSTSEISDTSLLSGYVSKYDFAGSIANNLDTTADGKVLDARQGKVISDKIDDIESRISAGVWATITIPSGGWSTTTTTVNGVAYYTHETTLSSVSDSHPDIYLGASNTFPTDTEKRAYMAVDYITVDSDANKLKCYARNKPLSNFVIIVKGVSA